MSKKEQIIQAAGKRKTAIARATLRPGKGIIRVNKIPIDKLNPKVVRHRIMEPLLLLGDDIRLSVDADVLVAGGGITCQADAVRIALCRGLCKLVGGSVRETLVAYDRTLLVADTRVKEKSNPNCHGMARSKRQKSYR